MSELIESNPPLNLYKVGDTVRYINYGVEKQDVIVRIGERSGIIFFSGGRLLFPESVLAVFPA
jgi:hypothetical protein